MLLSILIIFRQLLNISEFFYCCSMHFDFCHTLHGTQYTHHSLKHMLPQHRNTYNDVFLLINFTKV